MIDNDDSIFEESSKISSIEIETLKSLRSIIEVCNKFMGKFRNKEISEYDLNKAIHYEIDSKDNHIESIMENIFNKEFEKFSAKLCGINEILFLTFVPSYKGDFISSILDEIQERIFDEIMSFHPEILSYRKKVNEIIEIVNKFIEKEKTLEMFEKFV